MRKRQKEQILELVRQMEEAHGLIKKYVAQGNIRRAAELLEDCQNGGIAVGSLIEGTEGENHPAVTLLEAYCEEAYRIYTELTNGENVQAGANRAYKSLRQSLIQIENSINNDIKIRREAVFLPYKASMWDSLESVWRAAEEDPDCDAYVVPIPYYDKNPDGSFGRMHYEGDQYPDDVPVTMYSVFDLEAHHPDMIFVHNPYDTANYVTSIHPDYYSDKLKQVTDRLVYIPYFIIGETDPEDEKTADAVRHFCFTPVTIHADRVIVESEAVRQIYIRNYMKEARECGLTGDHINKRKLEQKFLGLGSPKYDKVLATTKEDVLRGREGNA